MNKYLEKIALDLNSQHAKDIRDTAVIGGLGGATSIGVHHLLTAPRIAKGLDAMGRGRKALAIGAVGTGLGLAADYAGLHINRGIDKALGSNTKEPNVPL